MTLAPMDFLSGTTCQLTPGTIQWGPGWYLIAENARVEAGPYATEDDAARAGRWMWDNAMGVHPGPWESRWSASGLIVGSRVRVRDQEQSGLALAG